MEKEKINFILSRHSCREFKKGEAIKEADLELLMEALRWAPSAGNCQPWFFYLVLNNEVKKGLALAAYGQDFIADAASVFVICTDEKESARYYGIRGKSLYCLQDTAAAVENLLIAANALGYGSCGIGAFAEDEVRAVLKTPKDLRPVAIVPVGPAEALKQYPGRKGVSGVFSVIK